MHEIVAESLIISPCDLNVASCIFQCTPRRWLRIRLRDWVKLAANDVRSGIKRQRSVRGAARHHELGVIELAVFVGDEGGVKLLLLGRRRRSTQLSASELMTVISGSLIVLSAWGDALLHAANASLNVVFSTT